MLSEINKSIIKMGQGLLAKLKYGITFHYCRYKYMSEREKKRTYFELKTYQTLIKKIQY